ncbi:single-stranded-DNA-specific exonuclease RecJ [Hufsiella ginkgonis]|uniref:Single-stranded-DNA-specific exonuclease RecJ n=1 Tax=Hufsiella ginkgonis TaxID=2695274 RepID=A0A7K1XSD7_9SPHI|nr:single-stranded-DNA-specific exonuclease RecJ [Hufsiella ginkgonis]MXV13874.1 single-stranded-DNA-specific exonuclease RecJ [Hufsiella ginkgonis]
MQKRWVEQGGMHRPEVADLQGSLQIDAVLATLLVQRGVSGYEEARRFFRPELAHLHDPFLMKDMEAAVSRIESAAASGEKVMIYGDYDVDGTTSVALTYSFFRKYIRHISFYIPDRYKEGYGISLAGIDFAKEHGYTLIVALDCGIKSVDKVAYANSLGIDFIICDHHLPGDSLPEAVAVLDPRRKDCDYPYKELSGCGIGFKLIQAFAQKNDISLSEITCYLDLVAVSIASDIVPITGENRVLAWHGLKRLNETPCNGLAALMDIAGRKEQYGISDVVFMIGPRINAAGRIDDARHAVNLLIADDKYSARDRSQLIDLKNTERKEHDVSITEQALEMLRTDESSLTKKTTVVFHETWHKGVIGIVASRLTEKYYRPTVVLTQNNGHISGSARSVLGFDLYEALSSCSELLDQFGGHKYAAGLTMKPENVVAFAARFEEVVAASIPDELLVREIAIDANLPLERLSPKFVRILNQFAPFGPGNMAPIFVSKNVYTYGTASVVGNNHLKMTVRQENSPVFECIGFGLGDHYEEIKKGVPFDICYTIEEKTWKEKRSLQLNIKGIRSVNAQRSFN